MKSTITDKLSELLERAKEIEGLLASAEVISNQPKFKALSKEHSEILPLTKTFLVYRETEKTITVDSENIVTTDSKRVVYDPAKGTEVEASVFQRENLNPGDCVMGPAIIVESQTTTWISSEKKSSTQKDDCLLITKKTEAAK